MRNIIATGLLLAACAAHLQAQTAELVELTASDASAFANLGSAIDLEGDRLLVGAAGEDEPSFDGGAAYVFERDASGAWDQVAKLVARDGQDFDQFGVAVALAGDRALIGAFQADGVTVNAGAAYLFERDGAGAWSQVVKLVATDGRSGDQFGVTLALEVGRALIGATHDNVPGAIDVGSAYVFEPDALGVWRQVAKLTTAVHSAGDHLGIVALDGDRALVGATQQFGGPGSAYVFERDGAGIWSEAAQLLASDGAGGDLFGGTVALSGDIALVGAYFDDSETGAAYVFERDGAGSWSETIKLVASDGDPFDDFGARLSLSGDRALISAFTDDDLASGAGSAYVFQRSSSGGWSELEKIVASDSALADFFGIAAALDGDRAAIGAFGDDGAGTSAGSAYLFDLEPLSGDVGSVSLSAGGTQALAIDAGHLRASEVYFMLGSASGTSPGLPLPGGLVLPLVVDDYFDLTLAAPNTVPVLDSLGLLSAAGSAGASFVVPPLTDPALAGLLVHHAFATFHLAPLTFTSVSQAEPVLLLP